MSEKIQEKSEYKIEHLEAEDAEKVAMTAEKKTLERPVKMPPRLRELLTKPHL